MPEELTIIDKGVIGSEDDDPKENGKSFISLSSFPKILPEKLLGIKHSNFTKNQVENLFSVRG